uniref:KRAB domain-containing protein n=1 Tax=Gopherus agassizii TaxID=38772 RepID=A0A452HMP0_9SAUR
QQQSQEENMALYVLPFLQVPVTFGDVSVHFSREQRKELYREVMKYNYGILVSLGEPRVGAAPEGEQHPHLEAGPGRLQTGDTQAGGLLTGHMEPPAPWGQVPGLPQTSCCVTFGKSLSLFVPLFPLCIIAPPYLPGACEDKGIKDCEVLS